MKKMNYSSLTENIRTQLSFIIIYILISFLIFLGSSSILIFLDNSFEKVPFSFIRKYGEITKLIFALFMGFLFVYSFHKRNDFKSFSIKWIIIFITSFIFSGLIHFFLGNSNYWSLKYLFIALFVGLISYFFHRKTEQNVAWFSGLIAIWSIFFGGEIEYFLTMEPSIYPSLFYLRSFPSFGLWIVTFSIIFLISYLLSKGFLIRKLL